MTALDPAWDSGNEAVAAAGAAWSNAQWAHRRSGGGSRNSLEALESGTAAGGPPHRSSGSGGGGSYGGSNKVRPSTVVSGATAALLSATLPSSVTSANAATGGGTSIKEPTAAATSTSSGGGASYGMSQVQTYGQLFEALLRGYSILPIGLYRRLQPGCGPAPPVIRDPAAQFVSSFCRTAQGVDEAPVFLNEKGLVSYVFTNPPQDTILNHLDYVYIVRSGVSNDDD